MTSRRRLRSSSLEQATVKSRGAAQYMGEGKGHGHIGCDFWQVVPALMIGCAVDRFRTAVLCGLYSRDIDAVLRLDLEEAARAWAHALAPRLGQATWLQLCRADQ